MRALLGIALVAVIGLIAAFATGLLDLNTQGGRMPEIHADAGQLPQVEMKAATVDVGTRKQEIDVPTVDVNKPARN